MDWSCSDTHKLVGDQFYQQRHSARSLLYSDAARVCHVVRGCDETGGKLQNPWFQCRLDAWLANKYVPLPLSYVYIFALCNQ